MRKVIMRTTLILAVLFLVGACEKEVVDTVSIKPDQATAVEPRVTPTCDPCLNGDVIFGPYSFLRKTGKPEWVTQPFTVEADGEICLQIHSLTVSAAWIELNGNQIFAPSDFDGTAAALDCKATLPAGNHTLTIKVAGEAGTIVDATIRACGSAPPPKSCEEVATEMCEGMGWQVVAVYPEEGLLYCTFDGRPATNCCDSYSVYNIFVWKDGAREMACCPDVPISTQAGKYYAGHPINPCECGDNLGIGFSWDMQGCTAD